MSERARTVVTRAIELAADRGTGVKAEHLLVALLAGDQETTAALEAMGVDTGALRSAADDLVRNLSA